MFILPDWTLILLFAAVVMAIVLIFSLLSAAFWKEFSNDLIESVEQFEIVGKADQTPSFVRGIDELHSVFTRLRDAHQSKINHIMVELSQKVAHDIRSPLSALSMAIGTAELSDERKSLCAQALKANRWNLRRTIVGAKEDEGPVS